MRAAMTDALKFWVEELDIDGYRCDVAGMVPTDFWDNARVELDSIKPVFMLAEDEDNVDLLRQAFDMNYAWKLHHIMNDIAQGKKNANDIWDYFVWNDSVYPSSVYRMNFTSNHDENSWNGTVEERMGDAGEVMAVLAYTVPGMGLIYSGQEAGNDKRLRFFEKDTINWEKQPLAELYTTLNNLKKDNKALWNGDFGGNMTRIGDGSNQFVYTFYRENGDDRVVVFLNLSDKPQKITINDVKIHGKYKDVFTGKEVKLEGNTFIDLEPWKYMVLEK
jgi:glycosidase